MSISNCCFLTCIQVSQEAGNVVWYSFTLKIFQFIVTHTVKGFSIVSEELDAFFWNFPAFSMIQRTLAIWSLVLLPFLNPTCTFGSSQFTACWGLAWRFSEHSFAQMWNECNCMVIWAFFGIAFLWDWNENWPLRFLWPLLSFPSFLACWVEHFYSIIFRIWNSSTGIPSAPLTLSIVMLPNIIDWLIDWICICLFAIVFVVYVSPYLMFLLLLQSSFISFILNKFIFQKCILVLTVFHFTINTWFFLNPLLVFLVIFFFNFSWNCSMHLNWWTVCIRLIPF